MPHAPRALSLLGGSLKFRRNNHDSSSAQQQNHADQQHGLPSIGTMPPGALTKFARGMTDHPNPMVGANGGPPRVQSNQAYHHNGMPISHYPPSSNPNPRQFTTAEATRLPLAKSSMPPRTPGHRPRGDSNSSMPPLGEPPAHALPLPPGVSPRRRANSEERGAFHSPSLPSVLGTPFNSPPRTNERFDNRHHAGHPENVRPPTRNLANTQRASNEMQPFVLTSNGSVNVVAPQPGPGVVRHHSTRSQHPDMAAAQGRGYPTQLGFKQSPVKHEMNLPIHDANFRRSYVGHSPTNGIPTEGRASSPTVDRRPMGFPRPIVMDRSREPTMFQEDEDYEEQEDLNSNYPFDDDVNGTPRASLKVEDKRGGGTLDGPSRPILRGLAKPKSEEEEKSKKRRRNSLDYDDIALQRMSYVELQKQAFDMDPTQAALDSRAFSSASESLAEKLDRCRDKGEKEQKQLFTQMDLADWERSGDWFLEQFSTITQRLKEARQAKRAMIDKFETEVASREEAVRLRTDTINKKLDKIKHKGEDMLADREV